MTYFTRKDAREPVPMPITEKTSCCYFSQSGKIVSNQPVKKRSFIKNTTKENNFAKKILYWICGIESALDSKNVNLVEENVSMQHLNISIEEEPFWSKVNYMNMVFQLCLSSFMWFFFNKFN